MEQTEAQGMNSTSRNDNGRILPRHKSQPLMAPFRRTKSINESSAPPPSAATKPNPPLSASSRSNSWTGKQMLPLTSSSSSTPPSPATPASSASSLDTVTPPPPQRTILSSFFRPSSSRPSTANSSRSTQSNSLKLSPHPTIEMSSSGSAAAGLSHEQLTKHADQLILNAIDRTRTLTRSDSITSNTSVGTSAELHASASTPSVQIATPTSASTPKSSWFGFGGSKQSKEDKDKRGRKSRPTSEIISSPIASVPLTPTSSIGGLSTAKLPSASKRPISLPMAPSPQVAASLKAIGSNPSGVPTTIPEGVPLTHSMTLDSMAPSEDGRGRRGRSFFRDRSSSPFKAFRSSRSRGAANQGGRSPSPAIHALKCSQSDAESDGEGIGAAMAKRRKKATRVRSSAFDAGDERVKVDDDDDEEEEEEWSEDEFGEDGEEDDYDDGFDPLTTQNTEANATSGDAEACMTAEGAIFPGYDDDIELPDPLGEGVNVVRPEEPLFAKSLMSTTTVDNIPHTTHQHHHASTSGDQPPPLTPAAVAARAPKRKKTLRGLHGGHFHDPLPLDTSRPHFARDRCTVVVKHGDPDGVAAAGGREGKRYLIFSDLSEESKWAVEWGIGTVLRDGDEMILVTVQETDSKLDPAEGATIDRLQKLRNQQERQALASLLVRQATSLLQRTKLNVTITCQSIHAKNARRLFLDIIDFIEPTMVIVGSRGLGKLKGILLGSTSHYLIQKSSVPVMVARRRLKRPTRKSHTAAQAVALRSEKRVSLADARIEKVSSGTGKGATGVDLDDIEKEHEEAEKEWPRSPQEADSDSGSESDEEGEGVKVAGTSAA